ncbi:uncharacterized protein LOC135397476 [Ornithodoros turicata]|uniref:uncharacterized protein LOC135397476 n=1 Tax=Ornithodoros turicata TaxID=34597 RepID=UPI00313A1912
MGFTAATGFIVCSVSILSALTQPTKLLRNREGYEVHVENDIERQRHGWPSVFGDKETNLRVRSAAALQMERVADNEPVSVVNGNNDTGKKTADWSIKAAKQILHQ